MGRQLTPEEQAERERRRVEARAAKEGRLRLRSALQQNALDAQVVRLTPAQEEQRRQDLAVRMAARESRLRGRDLQLVKGAAERLGDESIAEEATRLLTRADLERQATGGALRWLGAKFVLGWNWLARKAHAFLQAMMDFVPYWLVKRFAIRQGLAAILVLGGSMSAVCVGADGQVKWTDTLNLNGITTVGLNHVLDTVFHAGTQVTTWYMGLINGASTPTLAAADTMSSHAGWTEYTAYSQTNRVTWDEGAASSGSITNSTTMDFSMNASGTVAGGFLTSSSTKSGTSGTLFMTATFSGGNQSVGNGDTLKLTYTLNTTAS